MRDQTSEYIERQQEPGNHSHDADRKFRIEKAADPDTAIILGARIDVLEDRELTDGARVLFTRLLDLSLDPQSWFKRRGQVCISNMQLRERLWRSARAIYGWTKELEAQRHIWMTKLGRPNMQPMNVFHITALQPKRERGPELPSDGMYGNGYRRPAIPMPQGARGGVGKKRHYLLDQYGNPLLVQVPANTAPTRIFCGSLPQNLRVTSAQNDTCHPQNLREAPAKLAGPTRTKRHLPPAKNVTTPPQKPSLFIESQSEKERALDTPLNVQRGNAFKKGGENGYLLHVLEVLSARSSKEAELELTNSGAWWRLKYREDPDKACRVLAEIKRMITESVPFTVNPGACAVDLWSRFA